MGNVTHRDCGEGCDGGEMIELPVKLVGVMYTEQGVQLTFQLDSLEAPLGQFSAFQFWLTEEESWEIDLEPGDKYDVLFIRRDVSGDSVSDE